MNRTDDSRRITRRAALSVLLAESAAALLPRRGDAAPRPGSPPRYELTDPGTLPGQTSSGANVINNRGQIGGWVSDGGQGYAGDMTTQPTLWTDRKVRVLNSPSTPVYIYRNGKEEILNESYPFTEALKFASAVAVNERGDALICAQFRQYEGDLPRRIITSWQAPETTYYWNAKHQRFYYVYDGGSARGLLEDGTVDRGDIHWHEGKAKPIRFKAWPVYQPERINPSAIQRKGPSEQPPQLGTIHHFPLSQMFARNSRGQVLGQVMREMPPKPGDDYPQYEKIPVLWEADGTPRVLDESRMGSNAFTPLSVNKLNEAVGVMSINTSGPSAHFYTRGKLFDLNTLIAPEVAQGWKLTEARDINDRGQIVGNAKKGGYTRAFLLTPR